MFTNTYPHKFIHGNHMYVCIYTCDCAYIHVCYQKHRNQPCQELELICVLNLSMRCNPCKQEALFVLYMLKYIFGTCMYTCTHLLLWCLVIDAHKKGLQCGVHHLFACVVHHGAGVRDSEAHRIVVEYCVAAWPFVCMCVCTYVCTICVYLPCWDS
jgi:hypothetical protein